MIVRHSPGSRRITLGTGASKALNDIHPRRHHPALFERFMQLQKSANFSGLLVLNSVETLQSIE
jgi:hypothetical protein